MPQVTVFCHKTGTEFLMEKEAAEKAQAKGIVKITEQATPEFLTTRKQQKEEGSQGQK